MDGTIKKIIFSFEVCNEFRIIASEFPAIPFKKNPFFQIPLNR
jgi:hypothetical protein